jgi:TRAP-type C4-dicarboxylate transport system substrate-binding protein
MKKMAIGFLILAVAAGVALGGGRAAAATKVIAGEVSPDGSLPVRALEVFKAQAAKYSDGDLQVQIYPNSQLGSFLTMVTQMKAGLVNVMFIQPDALGAQSALATANSWPFLFADPQAMLAAWQGPGGQALIHDVEQQSGYRMLAPSWNGPRWIFTTRKAKSLADLQGMKIRVPGTAIYVEQMKLLGLSPTPMAVSEIFSGLQQGVVEGVEGVISDLSPLSVQEVTKTVIMTDHVISPKVFVTSGAWVNRLSSKDKSALARAMTDASTFYGKELERQIDSLRRSFEAKGIVFLKPTLSLAQFRDKEKPLQAALPKVWAEAQKLAVHP